MSKFVEVLAALIGWIVVGSIQLVLIIGFILLVVWIITFFPSF